ncbi:hypothetical protein CK203_114223 [Vitis vinifera]|uniref:Uncharacterized protein n=1 Tax=Vitis vinifera TaxID=29760 RepID=A0A438CA48_VITVI|nr:hypothetical protein CK203_114223 [Vitis vinifera]
MIARVVRSLEVKRNLEWASLDDRKTEGEEAALSLGVGGRKALSRLSYTIFYPSTIGRSIFEVKVAIVVKASGKIWGLIKEWWQEYEFKSSTSVVLFNKMQALRKDLKKWNRKDGRRGGAQGWYCYIKSMFEYSQAKRPDLATDLFKGIEALDKDLIEGFSWRMRCYLPSLIWTVIKR